MFALDNFFHNIAEKRVTKKQNKLMNAFERFADSQTKINDLAVKLAKEREELCETKWKLTALAENPLVLTWVKDVDGKFVYANKRTQEKLLMDDELGHTGEWYAKKYREKNGEDSYTLGEVCDKSEQIVQESKQPGTFLEDGYIDGEYFALMVYKAPKLDAKGRLQYTVGVAIDFTDIVGTLKTIKDGFETAPCQVVDGVCSGGFTKVNEFFDKYYFSMIDDEDSKGESVTLKGSGGNA